MSATIYSIAERCGVSPSTVSRALSRPELVSAELRTKILGIAEELAYRPNRHARGLAGGTTGMFGVTVPDIANPFFPPVVRALEKLAWQEGRSLLLVDTAESVDREEAAIGRLRGQVDGLVMLSPRAESPRLQAALGGLPAVMINRASRLLPYVTGDDASALQQVCDTLVGLGHTTIAYVSGPVDSWMNGRRFAQLHAAAKQTELKLASLGPFAASYDGGRAAARALLETDATAVVAFDDVMASGVLAELGEQHVQVPGDLSVIGCDDVAFSRLLRPSLSSIASAPDDLAGIALELLHHPPAERRHAQVPTEFVPRESSGPAPKRR